MEELLGRMKKPIICTCEKDCIATGINGNYKEKKKGRRQREKEREKKKRKFEEKSATRCGSLRGNPELFTLTLCFPIIPNVSVKVICYFFIIMRVRIISSY